MVVMTPTTRRQAGAPGDDGAGLRGGSIRLGERVASDETKARDPEVVRVHKVIRGAVPPAERVALPGPGQVFGAPRGEGTARRRAGPPRVMTMCGVSCARTAAVATPDMTTSVPRMIRLTAPPASLETLLPKELGQMVRDLDVVQVRHREGRVATDAECGELHQGDVA